MQLGNYFTNVISSTHIPNYKYNYFLENRSCQNIQFEKISLTKPSILVQLTKYFVQSTKPLTEINQTIFQLCYLLFPLTIFDKMTVVRELKENDTRYNMGMSNVLFKIQEELKICHAPFEFQSSEQYTFTKE